MMKIDENCWVLECNIEFFGQRVMDLSFRDESKFLAGVDLGLHE
jgi:hypothetical protein